MRLKRKRPGLFPAFSAGKNAQQREVPVTSESSRSGACCLLLGWGRVYCSHQSFCFYSM